MLAIESTHAARAAMEGAGVRIRRAIGIPEQPHLDPFLMLDYFDSERASDYLAGFPDHPHRGFITLTYMLAGRMEHRDSMGHRGVIGPGAAQWMKAARGVIHSEMPSQVEGRMAGFQLWINLPAQQKMTDPDYQEFERGDFPTWSSEGVEVRVLAGRVGDCVGPIEDPNTDVHYFDATLAPGARFSWQPPAGHRGFLFVYDGRVAAGDVTLTQARFGRLGGGTLALVAGDSGARLIIVSGQPIGEPIVQRGPFVMTSDREIRQAILDFQSGRLVRPAL